MPLNANDFIKQKRNDDSLLCIQKFLGTDFIFTELCISVSCSEGKVQKKIEKKLTNVSFMYVCVAGNGEMLVFFSFFPPTIV